MSKNNLHKRKLLLIGSTSNPVHIKNFYNLVKDYFDEVLIVGTHKVDFCKSIALDFGIKNPISVYKNIKVLRKIMIDFSPGIIHVHQANSVGFISSLANKKKFPLVLTTWGDDVLILPNKNFIYKKLTTTSLKYADAVTADADIMRKAIHSFYGKIDVTIANFGIEIQSSESVDKENVIYSNRLHDDLYNIDKIVLGVGDFLKVQPEWKLIIAAIGKNTDKLKSMVEEMGLQSQIEFVGFLKPEDNKRNYLKSKIYISIPNTDGTSISLLEAMAYGCIPIVSDLPANKEWITDQQNGIVLRKWDVSEAFQRVFDLDFEKAININHEIIDERATKKANRDKFVAIYDKLLD